MPGVAAPVGEDAQESQSEGDDAERQGQGPDDRLTDSDRRAVGPDHPDPEDGHPDGLPAEGPLVGEVEELPDDCGDERDAPGGC